MKNIHNTMPVFNVVAGIFALGLLAPPVLSQPLEPEQLAQETAAVVRDTDKFDWVRLTSGEWLKGEIIAIYDNELEFDSDVLDTLMIDMDDVHTLLSHKKQSVRFNDGSVLYGSIKYSSAGVSVDDGAPHPTSSLVSIAPAAESLLTAWDIKLGAGINISRGNTEKTEYSGTLDVKRRTASSRILADALLNREKNDGETTEQNIRAHGTFDWFYTNRLYFRPIFFEYYRDPFQNIGGKYTLGAGVGYYFFDTDKFSWDLAAGPAFQHTRFDNVAEGESSSNSSTSVYLASTMEYEFSSSIDLSFDYRYTVAQTAAGGDAQYAKFSSEFEVTDDIDFDVSFVWEHLASPVADNQGEVPEKSDYRTIISLEIEL